MHKQATSIYVGDTLQKTPMATTQGEYVTLLGESYYKIDHVDAMTPFFMSMVSSSDHWLFIASTGGLTAGRMNAEHVLFPYYTADKLTENAEYTGHKALLLVECQGRTSLWEPFSIRQQGAYAVRRTLYKNVTSTALIFEEINDDLGLMYRYAWRTSEQFGFVKSVWLHNMTAEPCHVEVVDGLQNVMPANVVSNVQHTMSVLVDAYKRNELNDANGLAIFALNSLLSDAAAPSESLLATTVFQLGLTSKTYLLSSVQLDRFRHGQRIVTETETRGQRGAYFAHDSFDLVPHQQRAWHFVADVRQDAAAIVQRSQWLHNDVPNLIQQLEADISANQAALWKIVASADGVQVSNDPLCCAAHFTNVMFNVMRGGIFADQYWITSADFIDFVRTRNHPILQTHAEFFATLPPKLHYSALLATAETLGSASLLRLCYGYLPLTFSRRHGDPSRPWNRFSINTRHTDGSMRLDYEGNWRDIFQNWEALALAYPEYVEGMITTFLSATTADGYNPYRITRDGLDWEMPNADDPWANIGYWSDHQIIYLQKLMELSYQYHPDKLRRLLDRPMFTYVHVPYRIKPYADLLRDPYNTIEFDWGLDKQLKARQAQIGTDAYLVLRRDGQLLQVSMSEKLLTLLLAKLSNFVPEGGIWMNTQRPEWNDANNALVGKGLSVVTLCYLRRFLAFYQALLRASLLDSLSISAEVAAYYQQVSQTLTQSQAVLAHCFTNSERRQLMDALGKAGSDYRHKFYRNGFSGNSIDVSVSELHDFLALAQTYIEHSLRANKRTDDLYHAYNILHLSEGQAAINTLYLMLEGQVAILSSGMLSGNESVRLLHALRHSNLYLADQQSYLLYPDREIPSFLDKNSLTPAQIAEVPLLQAMLNAKDDSIVTADMNGGYHFSSHIRNFNDIRQTLDARRSDPIYGSYIDAIDTNLDKLHALFENTFHHNEFTGRSGTFFAYEGLGSIYWHMVAKLLVAVQETLLRCEAEPCAADLLACYRDIRQGLSFHKSPAVYGAFPTDPYSHTPKARGAQQPGMTGLVKELILTRMAEVGLTIEHGQLQFSTLLLDPTELLDTAASFSYLDVYDEHQTLALEAGALAYSICQTPIILEAKPTASIRIYWTDGSTQVVEGNVLDAATSRHIFQRDGMIKYLTVGLPMVQ